jgi:hypothetical protein
MAQPITARPTPPLFVIPWKGNKGFCDGNTKFNCPRGQTKNSVVPKWSRPVENMGHRNPDWESTSIVIMPGPRDEQARDMGPKFKARPIKHWRKQLAPRVTTGYSTAGVGMPMDTPAGSIYLDKNNTVSSADNCCGTGDAYHISTYIPKAAVASSTDTDFLFVDPSCNPINPVFKKPMCCNPEKNVIKSATTLLSKKYYSDSQGYLKARCKTYDQRLSGTQVPGIDYFNAQSEPLWPTNSARGPQLRAIKNFYKSCAKNDSGCYGAPEESVIATTVYKPSNSQFAVQGAVSSSTRLDRLKLHTIQKSAHNQRTAWGAQSARAAAYSGKPDAPYYLKSKYSGDTKCKSVYHRKGNHTMCFNTPCHRTMGGQAFCHQIGGR